MISLPGRDKQFVRQFLVFTHLHLGLGKEAWPHFEEDALVLLHGSDGALDHSAGPRAALVQLRLELGQGALGPEKTNWTRNTMNGQQQQKIVRLE